MHKDDAAKLFALLSDGDRVKIVKKLYMNNVLSYDELKDIIDTSEEKLKKDLSQLVSANMIKVDQNSYTPNKDLIDELMNFIKTPCKCANKMTFSIIAYGLEFKYEGEKDSAWYDFDHAVSKNGEAELRIDANRDAYAFFKKNKDSKEIQGVIKDDDDNILADNYGVDDGYTYHFEECEKQGYFVR